ncbi:MAG TPA: NAD(+) diphosphatase [Gammaproteobacteria bacterium]
MFERIPFAGNAIDRLEQRRADPEWLAARLADPASRFLPFHELKPLIALQPATALGWVARESVAAFLDAGTEPLLLGAQRGRCCFAVEVGDGFSTPALADGTHKFIDTRSIAPNLPADASGLLAQARSLLAWHAQHRFCPGCGACGSLHYPRHDPVVIMLITHAGRTLLGRQHRFVSDFWSCLAGFVEPGETLEGAVRRESFEEAGVSIGAVRYLGSQPWPFPASLMLGCHAEALDDALEIDTGELAEARWFDRAECARMLAACQQQSGLRLPGPVAIAHHLVRHWLDGDG